MHKPENLKLIDCKERRLVRSQGSETYSALSYVWGPSGYHDEKPLSDGRLPKALPRTIEDALNVTQELGLRFVWIDRYCIDQDEEGEQYAQIRQMDLIYRNAHITIVAATGDSPRFGLPGVSSTQRLPQSDAWIGEQHLVSMFPHPANPIRNSKWAQRAWTFQEEYFSCRCLVFTEHQVYFECRAGAASESFADFGDRNYYSKILWTSNPRENSPWDIWDLLSEYCWRGLSLESDAIHAFEGVFNSFRNRDHPVYHFQGIPIIPSYVNGAGGDAIPSSRGRTEGFALGLCWRSRSPGTRRRVFPTWSWAGWATAIKRGSLGWNYRKERRDEQQPLIFVERLDGSLSNFEDTDTFSLATNSPRLFGRFIHLEAWTIALDIRYVPEEARVSPTG